MKVIRSIDRPPQRRAHPLPVLQRLVDGTVGATAMSVWRNELISGERVLRHSHDVEEVLLVTAGQCQIEAGPSVVDLTAGDAAIIPPHTPHGLRAIGAETAAVTAILASPDPHVAWQSPGTDADR